MKPEGQSLVKDLKHETRGKNSKYMKHETGMRVTVQFYSSQVKSHVPSEIFPFSKPILITDSFEGT